MKSRFVPQSKPSSAREKRRSLETVWSLTIDMQLLRRAFLDSTFATVPGYGRES